MTADMGADRNGGERNGGASFRGDRKITLIGFTPLGYLRELEASDRDRPIALVEVKFSAPAVRA